MSQPRHLIVVTLLFVNLLLGATTTVAHADQDQGWRLRLTAAAIQPTAGGGNDLEAGFGLGVGYRFSRRLSLEAEVLDVDLGTSADVEVHPTQSVRLVTQLDVTPILGRLNVHLTPSKRLDLFVGPVVGWVPSSDYVLDFRGTFVDGYPLRLPTDDTWVWGAHVGLDVPLGDAGVFLTSRLTYLEAEFEPDFGVDDFENPRVRLDPVLLQVGIGYRF